MNRLKENFVINVDTKPDAIDAVNVRIILNSMLLLKVLFGNYSDNCCSVRSSTIQYCFFGNLSFIL